MFKVNDRVLIMAPGRGPPPEGIVLRVLGQTLYEVQTDEGPIINFHESWLEEAAQKQEDVKP